MKREIKEKLIAYVLGNFDFESVYNIFEHQKYAYSNGVPTIYELVELAYELLEKSISCKIGCSVSSGRLTATYSPNNVDEKLTLKFIPIDSRINSDWFKRKQ